MTKYIVMTSSAKMPSTCKGEYRNVAIVEIEDGADYPLMISKRAKGVVRIVSQLPPTYVGKTDRCAYAKALAWATEQTEALNKARA